MSAHVTSVLAVQLQPAPVSTPNVKSPPREGTEDGRSVTVVEQVEGDGPGEGVGDGDGDGEGDGTGEGEGDGPDSLLHPTRRTATANGASRESSNRIMIRRAAAWRPPVAPRRQPALRMIRANSTVV